MEMKNVLCVDLEDWYNANLAVVDANEPESRVEMNTEELLAIFRGAKVRATFFVLGSLAEKYPELIKKIRAEGHEIASHGYSHQLVYTQTPEEFKEDVTKAKQITEEIIKDKIYTYRAPSWSIREDSFWALDVLKDVGFKNDSSIFPFKNFLYGVANAPRFPYSTAQYAPKTNLKEFPPSTVRMFGINVPFSGGFYFRFFPLFFIKKCVRSVNRKGHPAVMYIHPWEIDADTPKMKLNLRDKFIQYYGIKRCKKKLIQLVNSFSFVTMEEYRSGMGIDDENIDRNTGL